MWLWILLVLAVIAFFVIKSKTEKSSTSDSSSAGTQGSLESTAAESATSTASKVSDTVSSATAGVGAVAGAAVGAAAGAAASAANTVQETASHVAATAAATAKQAAQTVSNLPDLSVDTGNAGSDIREMIKILNLAAPDAGRLGVSKDTFAALRAGNEVSADDMSGVADKLKKMLA